MQVLYSKQTNMYEQSIRKLTNQIIDTKVTSLSYGLDSVLFQAGFHIFGLCASFGVSDSAEL